MKVYLCILREKTIGKSLLDVDILCYSSLSLLPYQSVKMTKSLHTEVLLSPRTLVRTENTAHH